MLGLQGLLLLQWHKLFLDALLGPEEWVAPANRAFPFKPDAVLRLCDLVEARLRGEPTLVEVQGAPISA